MCMLRLTYEPEDEWHGQLHALAKAGGFIGRSTSWFSRDTLIAFQRSLERYPIPVHAPAGIYGGLGADAIERPAEVLLGLTIAPIGVTGALLVQVELASDPAAVRHRTEIRQRVSLCFLAEYAALDRFRIALGPMLDSGAEALLQGT